MKIQPQWYKLKSKRKGNKKAVVSGEVQMQFSLFDSSNPAATEDETLRKYKSFIAADDEDDNDLSRATTIDEELDQDDAVEVGEEAEHETSDETDEPTKAASKASKKEKKKRMARLRRKSIAVRAYEFVGGVGDVSGIIFMEINKITDLPPERNSKLFIWR